MNKIKEIFREDSSYKPFLLSLVVIGLGYGLYKSILDNYLAEVAGFGELDRGVAEFFREVPGLLLVFILAVLYMLTAEAIYKIGLAVMVIGMLMHTVITPNKVMVIIALCMYSLGEHIQMGMKNTMALEYSKQGHGGEALGMLNSVSHIGNLAGNLIIAVVFAIFAANAPFRLVFAVSSVLMIAAFYFALQIKGSSETDKTKSRFYFKKKFMKYYMLEVFYGARKQVFMTFGPYVLILFYKANTSTISLLFALSSITATLLAPSVGKLIDKVGYKIIMISDTLILVIVCFFYGFAHHIFPMNIAFIVCCINYILDTVISMASMASNVYVQDISDSPDEVRATISTGVSVNHLITILIAIFGGWIWQALGIETLFMLSAVLGLANSAYAATIKPGNKITG